MIANQTLKFIMPLISEEVPKFYLRTDFIGAYLGDTKRPEFDGRLLLVYRYPYTREFAKFDNKLSKHDNYITSYDYGDQKLTVFVFDIDEFEETSEAVLTGAYSKIPAEDKLTISKFWITYSDSYLTQEVMNNEGYMVNAYWKKSGQKKEDCCKEGECWFIPKLYEEILDISKI